MSRVSHFKTFLLGLDSLNYFSVISDILSAVIGNILSKSSKWLMTKAFFSIYKVHLTQRRKTEKRHASLYTAKFGTYYVSLIFPSKKFFRKFQLCLIFFKAHLVLLFRLYCKYFLIYNFNQILTWSYLRSLLVINLDINFIIIIDFNAIIRNLFKHYFEQWIN